jgi:hypothetical protein
MHVVNYVLICTMLVGFKVQNFAAKIVGFYTSKNRVLCTTKL